MLATFTIKDIPAYTGFFEAHITINQLNKADSERFDTFCNGLGVKSIQIELSRGDMAIQPMTCSRHKGTFQEIYQEVVQIGKQLQEQGFDVLRLKIEAHPDNIGIPLDKVEVLHHSDKNYFEHHLKVLLNTDMDLSDLLAVCEKHQAHLSSNAYKKVDSGNYQNFITTRTYHVGKQEAKAHFSALMHDVQELDIPVLKHFMEYCVFDTNIDLDKNWLTLDSTCSTCTMTCFKNEELNNF